MASYDYTQTVDTLTTIELDGFTRNPANLINKGSHKLLGRLMSMGRFFVDPSPGEKLWHPMEYDGGVPSTVDYDMNNLAGAAVPHTAAFEHATKAYFEWVAGTRNMVFPQSFPTGTVLNSVRLRVRSNLAKMMHEEELFGWTGDKAGLAPVAVGPFKGDRANAAGGVLTSLPGILTIGNHGAGSTTFGGIDPIADAQLAEYLPHLGTASDATGGASTTTVLLDDLEDSLLDCSFGTGIMGQAEDPDIVYGTKAYYKKFWSQLLNKSIINDQSVANLGYLKPIPFASVDVDWSRYLALDPIWDVSDGTPDVTAMQPVLILNTRALRYNVTVGGGMNSDGNLDMAGFVRKISPTLPFEQTTNLYNRWEFQRCWSTESRRSSGIIEGYTFT